MVQAAKIPTSEHTRMPWRIHALTKDFRVEDVWSLPTPGGPDDFARLLQLMESFDPTAASPVVRALFAIRWRVGGWLGLDQDAAGLDARVASLRDRLPVVLPVATEVSTANESPFRPVYRADREAAFEIA